MPTKWEGGLTGVKFDIEQGEEGGESDFFKLSKFVSCNHFKKQKFKQIAQRKKFIGVPCESETKNISLQDSVS